MNIKRIRHKLAIALLAGVLPVVTFATTVYYDWSPRPPFERFFAGEGYIALEGVDASPG